MLNFSLTDLRYLIALAEEKHFARAAQKCFVSQPTLSIAIKKLEENLGITIFERKNHQILITPAGVNILLQTYNVINEANQLLTIAKTAQNQYAEPIRIGAILTIGPYIFPNLVNKIMQEVPQLQLILEENFTENLIDKLLSGTLDLILIATEIDNKEIVQEPFYEDELNLICSIQHQFAKQAKISSKLLTDETFLILGNGNCLRDQVLQICNNHTAPGNQITTSSLETIKYMVEMNIGVSILPKLAATQLSPKIIIKPFSGKAPKRVLRLAYRKSFPRKLLIEEIKTQLKSILN